MKTLAQKASQLIRKNYQKCTHFYRDKGQEYYDYIFDKRDGIMEKYEKDSHGDPANPINGQISGLFFNATMNKICGGPRSGSIFGEKRVKIKPYLLLNEHKNLYFADFYCIKTAHWVQLAIATKYTKEDETCRRLLTKLDKYDNPFLYISKSKPKFISVTTDVLVEVFYADNVNLISCGIEDQDDLETVQSSGYSRIDGIAKNECCPVCNL